MDTNCCLPGTLCATANVDSRAKAGVSSRVAHALTVIARDVLSGPRQQGANELPTTQNEPFCPSSYNTISLCYKQFGLTHLLEAAEQCSPVPLTPQSLEQSQNQNQISTQLLRKRSFNEQPSPVFLQSQSQPRIPSLTGFLAPMDESDRSYKRPRPDTFHQPSPPQLYEADSQLFPYQPSSFNHSPPSSGSIVATPSVTTSSHHSSSPITALPSLIWDTVLASGAFPAGVGLSESASQSLAADAADADNDSSAVKQGRWSCDETQFAEAMIQSVHRGEAVLPPKVSLRRYIAGNLQCKAMRVSKKFRSLRASQGSPSSPTSSDDQEQCEKRCFNPLSLQSIMNNTTSDGGSGVASSSMAASYGPPFEPAETPGASTSFSGAAKKAQRVLKRSDYSQHGTVRSGRWSLEEENYAKAMIEAFKNGYLPLHGNVSLRKFLSEVLVCHPMRISKKFVGYVRKYHWYSVAAGQSEPEAKQAALEQLAHLERVFWASTQQSTTEWTGPVVPADQPQPLDE